MDGSMIKVSNRSKRPTESAKSRLNGHVYEHVVHEHLVRARSRKLAETIDEKKKQAKGNEEVTIQITASSQMVGCWLRWLYGQPMFTWDDGIHDEVLENHVEMYDLACEADDYGCMNACLDAIREFLCQPKPSRLENPIFALKSMLEPKLTLDGDVDQTNNKPTDMIVDVLVYGPCADSGQTAEWLNFLKNDMYPIEEQAWFYQKLCIVSAKKLAQRPGIILLLAPHPTTWLFTSTTSARKERSFAVTARRLARCLLKPARGKFE